ncbi:MAG: peptidylprolyl isomerase [Verrucomicrobiales bacterium]|nr:peptidylprolyl isomerase [Verrucomicrobiales bacterium]
MVEIKTSEGIIRAELFKEQSPKTVENFLSYVGKKHYDNTIFHRVIKGFMVQGGGFENQNGNFVEKATDPPVVNEAGNRLKNHRGTLAMARTNDPHSATSQFFINTANNGKLNLGDPQAVSPDGYAVFGKVISGMAVVDKIEQSPTGTQTLKARLPGGQIQDQPSQDVPVKKILIESISLVPQS